MVNSAKLFEQYTDAESFSKIVDYENVCQMWEHSVRQYPDNVAIVDGEEVTYSALDDAVAKFRAELLHGGVKKGDNVGLFAHNSLFFVKAYLAIVTLGACAVLLPVHLDGETLCWCAEQFKITALVYSRKLSDTVQPLEQGKSNIAYITEGGGEFSPAPAEKVQKTTPCTIIFTGGSSGKIKGAQLSHQAMARGAKNGCYGIRQVFEQKLLLVLPLTHVFGIVRNLLTPIYTGSTVYVCKNNKDMFKDIAAFRPTTLVFVPAFAEMALSLSKRFKRNLLGDSVHTVICGAASVSPQLAEEYNRLNITLLTGYGLTESANLVSGNPRLLEDPSSVGYVYPGIEYKVVDDELWIKGVNVMDGYYGEEEETASAFEDGFFKTGDLVEISEDGRLYITGQKKQMIVLASGENVYPAEIERRINGIEGVSCSLVYECDQHLYAEIFPKADAENLSGGNLQEYFELQVAQVNKTLAPYERINKVIIRQEDFERSADGKILRGKNAKK